jgi:hypothetical protein
MVLPKVDPKSTTPKVDPKSTTPKVDPKSTTPKVDPKSIVSLFVCICVTSFQLDFYLANK